MNTNEREPREFISVYSRSFAVNSGHRLEDHFVDVTEMVEIGRLDSKETANEPNEREVSKRFIGVNSRVFAVNKGAE